MIRKVLGAIINEFEQDADGSDVPLDTEHGSPHAVSGNYQLLLTAV